MRNERYNSCLLDRVINIREDQDHQEFIANTLDGNEVYIKPQDYIFDRKIDDKKYYTLRNHI